MGVLFPMDTRVSTCVITVGQLSMSRYDGEKEITVNRADLEAVLAVVPPWVPEGARGDMDWTPESLEAKDRLQKALDRASEFRDRERRSASIVASSRRGWGW